MFSDSYPSCILSFTKGLLFQNLEYDSQSENNILINFVCAYKKFIFLLMKILTFSLKNLLL